MEVEPTQYPETELYRSFFKQLFVFQYLQPRMLKWMLRPQMGSLEFTLENYISYGAREGQGLDGMQERRKSGFLSKEVD